MKKHSAQQLWFRLKLPKLKNPVPPKDRKLLKAQGWSLWDIVHVTQADKAIDDCLQVHRENATKLKIEKGVCAIYYRPNPDNPF